MSVLGKAKIEMIHEATITLLETVGMKIQGNRAKKLLLSNGCLSKGEDIILIPRFLVEQALRSVPGELIFYTRDGEPSIVIDNKNKVYFGTHADQLEFVDPFTGLVRKFKKADTAFMCKLADALPNIHFILSVGMSSDVPPQLQSQTTFIETVRNFKKPINFSTNDIQGLRDIIEMAITIAGGADNLAQKPFIFHYCEPLPPLTHPVESTEKLMICAENRIPVVYMPYCMMGGTSAISFAGTLAQCNAEVLTGLVISQLTEEGAPFIYGAMPSIFDMRTTIGSYGAPELHLLIAAAAELSNSYNIPFYGTAGCSDAKVIDEQAVAEITFEIFSSLLSHANLVHDIGVMDHCNSVSPEIVVLANEIIEGLGHYCRGVPVETSDFALDVISRVAPGGHYLGEEHTLKNFKNIWYPKFFSRAMINQETSTLRPDIRQFLQDIAQSQPIPDLSEKLLTELAKWDQKLAQRIQTS